MKIVIIGGVAAGMSAAAKAKRIDKNTEVIVYEKGPVLSYGACGLPYYVSGANDDYRRMIMRTQDDFDKQGIVTKLHHEVLKVNTEEKHVMVKDWLSGQVFIESYDKLMLATGARPITPNLPGVELDGVMELKTLQDGINMRQKVMDPNIKNIAIVGAGYIGIELAEAMVELGKQVQVIEFSDRILRSFDKEFSDMAEQELRNHGVALHLSEGVKAIRGNGKVNAVETDKGVYPADLVILAIGVKPNTEFLKDSGVQLTKRGAIIIDREMKTTVPDVYAAGDCATVYHAVKEENDFIPLGTTANKCGRIAGSNMMGHKEKFMGTLGSAAIKVLGIELGRTGLSAEEAAAQRIDFGTQLVTSYNHPPYYPNQAPIHIKLIYEKRTHRLLGAQAVGGEGTVLRVNSMAIAIQNHMTTEALGMVDLIYAPPFAGVWDAIHIAANAVK
ncbi:MAG: CoA-disulfide reductase [Clostridia bacterium]|nr:CoA-disulfide reductase [Clostridia bacterium]